MKTQTAPTQTHQTQRVKIGSILYDYRRKHAHPPQATVPWLQLKGHWLARAGFTVDTPVRVEVMDGCLVITVAPGG